MKINNRKLKKAFTQTAISLSVMGIVNYLAYYFSEMKLFSWRFMIILFVIYFSSNYFLADKELSWKDIFKTKNNGLS